MQTTKYLYLSKSKQWGKVNARISATKQATKKNEICIKLELDIPKEAFEDSIPTATVNIPKDYKRRKINLRLG